MLSPLGCSTSVEVYIYFAYLPPGVLRLHRKYQAATAHTVKSNLISTNAIGTHLYLEAEPRYVSKGTFFRHDSSVHQHQ